VGQLRLIDSHGREVCGMTNDAILDRLVARQVLIVDPSRRPLVLVGTEPVPGTAMHVGEVSAYQGVIYLNNRPLGTGIRLAPPATRPQAPAAESKEPAEESSDDAS